MEWLFNVIGMIFLWLDQIIYGFIVTIYDLLIEISETSIFTNDVLAPFSQRIYALLGIFMLFKVTFSFFSYIINPDEISDKEKGVGKLVNNILITLVLIVVTPWAFTQAMDIQRLVIRDGVINKLFSSNLDGISNSYQLDAGRIMSYTTLKAFYHLDMENEEVFNACNGYDTLTFTDAQKEACRAVIGDANFDIVDYSEKTNSVQLFLNYSLAVAKSPNGQKIISYTGLISTVAGVIILLLLIVFCFDIAVRSIKLGFYQLLAPIPIISRIDPKSAKNGMFSKWLKAVMTTYADLFLRLIAISFSTFIIGLVGNGSIVNIVTGEKSTNIFVNVFIIIGALLFAKELPKIIEDLTGIKFEGKFHINPLRKLQGIPLAGGALGAAGSLVKNAGALGGKAAFATPKAALAGASSFIRRQGFESGYRKSIGKTQSQLQKRVRYAQDEARERLQNGGFANTLKGNDKYQGTVAGDALRKETAEESKKIIAAERKMRDSQALFDIGKASMDRVPKLKTESDYRAAGYKSKEFIASKMSIEEQKDRVKFAQAEAQAASNTLQAKVNALNMMPVPPDQPLTREDIQKRYASELEGKMITQEQYDEGIANIDKELIQNEMLETAYKQKEQEVKDFQNGDYAAAQETYEGMQKGLQALEKNHDEYVVPRNSQDAELDMSRKIAKSNFRPGTTTNEKKEVSTKVEIKPQAATVERTSTSTSTRVPTSAELEQAVAEKDAAMLKATIASDSEMKAAQAKLNQAVKNEQELRKQYNDSQDVSPHDGVKDSSQALEQKLADLRKQRDKLSNRAEKLSFDDIKYAKELSVIKSQTDKLDAQITKTQSELIDRNNLS